MVFVAIVVLVGAALLAALVVRRVTRRREQGAGDPDFWKRDLADLDELDLPIAGDDPRRPSQLELELAAHAAT